MEKEKIRITKEDLKRNDLLDIIYRIKDFFSENKQQLKPYLIIGGVVIVAVIIFVTSINRKKADANDIYTEALYEYSNKIFSNDTDYDQIISQFQKAYNTYSSSNFSKVILFNIADAYYRKGDYQNAIINYDKFISAAPDKKFETMGRFGKGLSMMQLKKYEDALKIFETLLPDENARLVKPDIIIQCAIANSQLNNAAKAEEYLKKISDDTSYAETSWKNYADYMKILLKQKNQMPTVNYSLLDSGLTDTSFIKPYAASAPDTKTVSADTKAIAAEMKSKRPGF